MDPNVNPFFADATDFTNMLLSGLLDGLNFCNEGASSSLESDESSLSKEVLQDMSGPSRTGSCSDLGSTSTACSEDEIHSTIRSAWSSTSQEPSQTEEGSVVLERLMSNYSRLSSSENSEKISALIASRRVSIRKPSDEDDSSNSPPTSPNSIHLNPDIQAAIKMASITIYQGLVRHVDRFNDPTIKDGSIVLCIDPTRKPLQNESSGQVPVGASVRSDVESAKPPALASSGVNLELAVVENEQDVAVVSKSLSSSTQGQKAGDNALESASSTCQDLSFDLQKDTSPDPRSGSDACKYSSPEPASSFDMHKDSSSECESALYMYKDSSPDYQNGLYLRKSSTQEPKEGPDLPKDFTPDPTDKDTGPQTFSRNSACLEKDVQGDPGVKDASKLPSPSLVEEDQNEDEKAHACEAFYLPDEEEEDLAYKPLSSAGPEEEDVSAVSWPACPDSDLAQDNVARGEKEGDIGQAEKASKSSSPLSTNDWGIDGTTVRPIQDMNVKEDDVEPKEQVPIPLSSAPGEEQPKDVTPFFSTGQELDQVKDFEREKETAIESLCTSPTKEDRDGATSDVMAVCEVPDREVEKEDNTTTAKSLIPPPSEPQQQEETVTSPSRDNQISDVEVKLCLSAQEKSGEEIPEVPQSNLETISEDIRAIVAPDKTSPEDGYMSEGTPTKLQSPVSPRDDSSLVSSLSSLEDIVRHKDSGDETQQKKAPLILEEYFNEAMKKFSNTLLDALISTLQTYKDPNMDMPSTVQGKSEKSNFAWNQEVGEIDNVKQDGEKSPSQSLLSGLSGQDSPCETL